MYCKICDKDVCICKPQVFGPAGCTFYDPLYGKCNKRHEISVPKPGVVPKGSARDYPEDYNLYCIAHYEYDRPHDWLDELLMRHQRKLEVQYGEFANHRGHDMAAHCLTIMYKIGGVGDVIAAKLKNSSASQRV